jgi:drug/metabolite transporter (DMT)-like permease
MANPLDELDDRPGPMRRGWRSPATVPTDQVQPFRNGQATKQDDASSKAVPGRARRRVPLPPTPSKKKKQASFWHRFYARWIQGYSPLLLAVLLWYLLGVVSIGTSKLLLSKPSHHHDHVGNVPPLYLTLQQLFLGSNLLRFLLWIGAFGSTGLQPFPSLAPVTTSHRSRHLQPRSFWKSHQAQLILTALYFTFGFLATNYCFERSSASFVETIKAAEPITSAAVAVGWGIETLGSREVTSLLAIVSGVLLSTWGNAQADTR